MLAIVSLLVVVTLSILITRIATVALSYTGLSSETARFQARSAFTGVGFTTDESEKVVNHPVRRRILLFLMLLGNAGIVTAVSSLMLSFVGANSEGTLPKIVVLVTGLVILWGVASSHWVDRRLSKLIAWALKRYTRLDVRDYASLLHLAGDYRVTELRVGEDDWLADKQLSESAPRSEGVVVLGIQRKEGKYLGAPDGETKLCPGDTVLLYGRENALIELDQRRKGRGGDSAHQAAVTTQKRVEEEEDAEDPAKEDMRAKRG
jgi:K+/H+ antiporter YhaU regulatory subunit KhtT